MSSSVSTYCPGLLYTFTYFVRLIWVYTVHFKCLFYDYQNCLYYSQDLYYYFLASFSLDFYSRNASSLLMCEGCLLNIQKHLQGFCTTKVQIVSWKDNSLLVYLHIYRDSPTQYFLGNILDCRLILDSVQIQYFVLSGINSHRNSLKKNF